MGLLCFRQSRLYPIAEVWPLKRFHNQAFMAVQTVISQVTQLVSGMEPACQDAVAGSFVYRGVADVLSLYITDVLKEVQVPLTISAVERVRAELLADDCSLKLREVFDRVNDVCSRLFDELESRGKFFYIPIDRAKFFDLSEPYGESVSRKFPKLTEDIQEAARCYCCGRFTACVFHLMRVMEGGLQKLGKKLQVKTTDAVWQVVLDQVNCAIKAMPPKATKTKQCATMAGHLYNVKLAWRNEVMHPKETYTEEEAENLLKQVGIFMQSLAKVV